MHGRFYLKSSTLRLYTKWSEGGQRVVSVRATVQDETTKIEALGECLRLQISTLHVTTNKELAFYQWLKRS